MNKELLPHSGMGKKYTGYVNGIQLLGVNVREVVYQFESKPVRDSKSEIQLNGNNKINAIVQNLTLCWSRCW